MAVSGSRLLSSNRAGWAMAAPAFGLILLFIIVPFALAFGLSFTNQRLFSPNPTEWVGAENFKQLLGVGVLTLERAAGPTFEADDRRLAHAVAAMLGPAWGLDQMLDIEVPQIREDLARISVMALSYVAQSARGQGKPMVPQNSPSHIQRR